MMQGETGNQPSPKLSAFQIQFRQRNSQLRLTNCGGVRQRKSNVACLLVMLASIFSSSVSRGMMGSAIIGMGESAKGQIHEGGGSDRSPIRPFSPPPFGFDACPGHGELAVGLNRLWGLGREVDVGQFPVVVVNQLDVPFVRIDEGEKVVSRCTVIGQVNHLQTEIVDFLEIAFDAIGLPLAIDRAVQRDVGKIRGAQGFYHSRMVAQQRSLGLLDLLSEADFGVRA